MSNQEDDAIGLCSECKSDQMDSTMFRSVFAQNGVSPVCKYCGGVVIIVMRSQREQAINQLDRERGL
jgi:hypothetical protein